MAGTNPEKVQWRGGTMLWPLPVVLVTCQGRDGPPNIITIAWTGIVATKPPQLSISLTPARHSYQMILDTGEFVVNIPSARLTRAVDLCGVLSGRTVDKFARTRLTPEPAAQVQPPLIRECPLNLECRVSRTLELGSHVLFVAEILRVHADSGLLEEDGRLALERAGLISFCHGGYYSLGRRIGQFGFSVRRRPPTRPAKSLRPRSAGRRG